MIVIPPKPPLARVSYCTYPGQGFGSRGHSFIAIQPLDPNFRSGSLELNQQTFIGRVGIGIAPSFQSGCSSIFNKVQPQSPLQIRNDTNYLVKNDLRATSALIYEEANLARGFDRINSAAQQFQQDFQIKTARPSQASQCAENKPPTNDSATFHTQSSMYSSTDGAFFLMEGFVDELPQELLENYTPGISSRALWQTMRTPLSTLSSHPLPQTPNLLNIRQLLALRDNLPVFLGETSLLIQNMCADLSELEDAIEEVRTELDTLQSKYKPLLNLAQENIKSTAPLLAPLTVRIPTLIHNLSQLIERSNTKTRPLSSQQILTQVLLSPHGRAQVQQTLDNSQELVKELDSLLGSLKKMPLEQKPFNTLRQDLPEDFTTLSSSVQKLSTLSLELVPRITIYLGQLNRLILGVLATG